MTRLIMLAATVSGLAACGAQPAPEFFGATRVDLTRDGRSFTVFHTENRVEVIRLGHPGGQSRAEVRATMMALASEITGCAVVESSVRGDNVEIRGDLICPD